MLPHLANKGAIVDDIANRPNMHTILHDFAYTISKTIRRWYLRTPQKRAWTRTPTSAWLAGVFIVPVSPNTHNFYSPEPGN